MKAKVVILEESVTRFKDLEAGDVYFYPEKEHIPQEEPFMKVEPQYECLDSEGWNCIDLDCGFIHKEAPDTVVIPAKSVELRVGK